MPMILLSQFGDSYEKHAIMVCRDPVNDYKSSYL